MSCSNGHSDVTLVNSVDDGQGYCEKEDYVCNKCGEEYTWVMTKTITKKGEEK